ncbi:uncharacterized protein LOC129593766 [Paramacrobiotus metropolitanus]|uniref:uncharacterized protein LOC129593766 n=1 Tax=Paramacrobiotus metropolitanus TaxID=2943436 RepID=UPI0024462CAA|nr:uncharacterized protein LOC129593766 [Paramacrobiotus metropolitanus]
MALLFPLISVMMFASLVYGASDTKGKMTEITSRTAICDQKISYASSKSEDDCANKCRKDSKCRFAVFKTKDRMCGLVPASFDCIFQRDQNKLIGFAYKKFSQRDRVQIKSPLLKNKKGQAVVDSSYGTPAEECQAMCDIHPSCQAAQFSSMRGENSCSLLAKAGPTNKQGADDRGTNIAFVAA